MIGPSKHWLHETISVPIGQPTRKPDGTIVPATEYVFQTLSLFDVWVIWPHLLPIRRAIERGKPLDFQDHVKEVLRIIQPVLANDDVKMREFTPAHVDLLINFYERQDWKRIEALCQQTTAAGAADRGADPEKAQQMFVLICQETARRCNMSMLEFIQQRFEFCADQIVTLRAHAEREAEQIGPRLDSWDELTNRARSVFGTVRSEPSPLIKKLSELELN